MYQIQVLSFLVQGLVLGFSAGISPGPLTALTISQTIKHNKKEGIKVAMAPLITDAPIVAVSILILSKLANFDLVIGLVSLIGAAFLFSLGLDSLKTVQISESQLHLSPKSLYKGVVANFLSPHPYLFWIAVGAPLTLKAVEINHFAGWIFILSFYFSLVSSKASIAVLVEKSKVFLSSKNYIKIMRVLGLILILFALIFLKDAINYLT